MPGTGRDAKEVFLHALEGREGRWDGAGGSRSCPQASLRTMLRGEVGAGCLQPLPIQHRVPQLMISKGFAFICYPVSHPAPPPAPQGAPKVTLAKSRILHLHPTLDQSRAGCPAQGLPVLSNRQVFCGLLHDFTQERYRHLLETVLEPRLPLCH